MRLSRQASVFCLASLPIWTGSSSTTSIACDDIDTYFPLTVSAHIHPCLSSSNGQIKVCDIILYIFSGLHSTWHIIMSIPVCMYMYHISCVLNFPATTNSTHIPFNRTTTYLFVRCSFPPYFTLFSFLFNIRELVTKLPSVDDRSLSMLLKRRYLLLSIYLVWMWWLLP